MKILTYGNMGEFKMSEPLKFERSEGPNALMVSYGPYLARVVKTLKDTLLQDGAAVGTIEVGKYKAGVRTLLHALGERDVTPFNRDRALEFCEKLIRADVYKSAHALTPPVWTSVLAQSEEAWVGKMNLTAYDTRGREEYDSFSGRVLPAAPAARPKHTYDDGITFRTPAAVKLWCEATAYASLQLDEERYPPAVKPETTPEPAQPKKEEPMKPPAMTWEPSTSATPDCFDFVKELKNTPAECPVSVRLGKDTRTPIETWCVAVRNKRTRTVVFQNQLMYDQTAPNARVTFTTEAAAQKFGEMYAKMETLKAEYEVPEFNDARLMVDGALGPTYVLSHNEYSRGIQVYYNGKSVYSVGSEYSPNGIRIDNKETSLFLGEVASYADVYDRLQTEAPFLPRKQGAKPAAPEPKQDEKRPASPNQVPDYGIPMQPAKPEVKEVETDKTDQRSMWHNPDLGVTYSPAECGIAVTQGVPMNDKSFTQQNTAQPAFTSGAKCAAPDPTSDPALNWFQNTAVPLTHTQADLDAAVLKARIEERVRACEIFGEMYDDLTDAQDNDGDDLPPSVISSARKSFNMMIGSRLLKGSSRSPGDETIKEECTRVLSGK